jgi:predicted O-methyltransferase YrrM
MTPKEINNKVKIQDELSKVPVKVEDAEFIYNFIKKNNLKKTLETGLAQGRSAAHIIAASGNSHVAMDPFQEEEFENIGLRNIKELGFDHLLEFKNEYSYEFLPNLLREKRKFEFIFLDGDHKFDGEFIDFFYGDLLLEEKGYILLHDTWLRSTQYLIKYIEKNRKNYIRLKTPLKNFCLFQKVGNYDRWWLHFNEFITFKKIIKYRLTMFTGRHGNNYIIKILKKIKHSIT